MLTILTKLIEIINNIPKFVRTDFGGKGVPVIKQRLINAGYPSSVDNVAIYKLGAIDTRDTISKYMKTQLDKVKTLLK